MNMEDVFSRMVSTGVWGSPETPCGPGSSLDACRPILNKLPTWISSYGISSIVDLGCGDFHWMKEVDFGDVEYDGYDVVRSLIIENEKKYGTPTRRFHHADILSVVIPRADLIICKDVLFHLPTGYALALLGRILRSKSRYLAATTHRGWPPERRNGLEIGGFSPVDLENAPFSMGRSIDSVQVSTRMQNHPKFFGLWSMNKESHS